MNRAYWLLSALLCVNTLVTAQQDSPASVAIQQIAVPCRLVEDRAVQSLEKHDFRTGRTIEGDDIIIALNNRTDVLTPSAKPFTLNRSSIHRYTLPRYLSPFKVYDDFRLEGRLRLAKASEEPCNASLHFEFSAFEWSWVFAVIDDGYRSKFTSNGRLERLYLDSISDLFAKSEP